MAHKRSRTPNDAQEGPSAKRNRTSNPHPSYYSNSPLNFNTCFSDEIVLHIFAYLDYRELCDIQTVDSHWARLASDNALWKWLFLKDHPSQRLRGARGFSSRWVSEIAPGGGREIKPLPARLALADNQIYYYPFKWMYRVSRNWRIGRCSYERLPSTSPFATLGPTSPSVPTSCRTSRLILAGEVLIHASDSSQLGHALVIQSPGHPAFRIPCPETITCLALDHSPSSESHASRTNADVHVACFYSNGQFSVFSVPPAHPSRASETFRCLRPQRSRSGNPAAVHHAVYRHPLLITLSEELDLSIWDVATPGQSSAHPIHTYRSYSSFPPLSMSLSSTSSLGADGETWKLLLVYCSPIYPSHWLPSASELTLSRTSIGRLDSSTTTITGSRKSKSLVAAHGWISDDERAEMEAEWARKMGSVDVVETDGKFLVAAAGKGDNTLQVYRLHYRGELRLSYVRTLEGHPGGIAAMKVADGRCVSVGRNGRLKVWDLEVGWDVEVDPWTYHSFSEEGAEVTEMLAGKLADVAFDERRVVSVDRETESAGIWRFDL